MLDITRRRDLHEFVAEVVSHTYERLLAGERFDVGQAMLKTYVVEKHPDGGPPLEDRESDHFFLANAVEQLGGRVAETEDPRLFLFEIPTEDEGRERVSFAVDMLDDRYWQIHTAAQTTEADPLMRRLTTEGGYLDTAWLPGRYLNAFSERGSIYKVRVGFDDATLLSSIPRGRHQPVLRVDGEGEWQLVDSIAYAPSEEEEARRRALGYEEGQSALTFSLRDYVDLRDGLTELHGTRYFSGALNITRAEFRYFLNGDIEEFSNARLYNWGKVTASGTSGAAHLDLMNRFVSDYRQRIERLEAELGCRPEPNHNDAALSAQPASIEYGEVEDFETFVLNLFSGNKPFRIEGTPRFRNEGYAVINAFDLHARQPLRFEVSDTYMTVLVPPGGCGNTIARLYTNLLEHLDANAVLYGRSSSRPFF